MLIPPYLGCVCAYIYTYFYLIHTYILFNLFYIELIYNLFIVSILLSSSRHEFFLSFSILSTNNPLLYSNNEIPLTCHVPSCMIFLAISQLTIPFFFFAELFLYLSLVSFFSLKLILNICMFFLKEFIMF